MIRKIKYKTITGIVKRRRPYFLAGLTLVLLCLLSQGSYANVAVNDEVPIDFQSLVSGVVKDADGIALPGASIVEKGTVNGTQTDFDGNYNLEVGPNAILVVSYVGFATQEIAVEGRSNIEITLLADANQLDEVVITGYSAQSTRDITGSVSTVKSENLEATAPTGVEQALQGQASGVVVGSQGGPGGSAAIRIRGFGTINGNNPLFIIDGTPTEAGLNDLNPNDIESIQILKDASSAAIYGNRAANGVVIITTKGGKKNQKLTFNANTYVALDFIPDSAFPELASPQQVAESVFREITNSGGINDHPQFGNGPNPVLPNFLLPQGSDTDQGIVYDPSQRATTVTRSNPQGTDWFDEYFNSAITQSYNISANAGTENSTFFTSLSVLDQEGVGLESGFVRYTLRANTSFNITDRFRIGENITVSYSDQVTPPGTDVNNGTIANLFRLNPLIPVRDVGGRFAGSGVGGLGNGNNPIAIADRNKDNDNISFRALGNAFAEFDIVEDLTFKTNLGFDILSFKQNWFQPPATEGEIFDTSTRLFERNDLQRDYTWFNTLDYSKSLSEVVDLDVLVGTEYNRRVFSSTLVFRDSFDFFDPEFRFFDNGTGAFAGRGNGFTRSYFSFFTKADVKLWDKYLFSATLRYDEDSRFSEDNNSAWFPSASIGWRVSDEDFLKDSNVIDNLLFKVGYGEVGNAAGIDANSRATTIGPNTGTFNFPVGNTSSVAGLGIDARGNPDITWETTTTINIGFNSRLFNRLNFDFEWYNAVTEDVLLGVPRDPTVFGNNNTIITNIGEIENNGFDASLSYDNYNSDGDFRFSVGLNVSGYENEVNFLDPNNPDSFIEGQQLRDQRPTRTLQGFPISSFWGNTWVGIENGRVVFDELDDDGNPVPGVIGNPHPDFTYGLNFNGSYRGFDTSILFQGSQGNDIYNFNKFFTDFNKFAGGRSVDYVLERGLPAVTADADLINREAAASTHYVEDGSYLRMKNIVIGYTLPEKFSDKFGFEKFRIYLQGKNLITITDYTGLDPEVSLRSFPGSVGAPSVIQSTDPANFNPNLTIGVDTGVYPINRSVLLGINLTY